MLSQYEKKQEIYKSLIERIKTYTENQTNLMPLLETVVNEIDKAFRFFWTGFYLVKDDQLHLGPYKGDEACLRISYGRGVCGTAWKENRSIVVPDVSVFPGHIACSTLSKSEIVIPLVAGNTVYGVLDIDSERLDMFDDTDRKNLEEITRLIVPFFI